MAGDRAPREGRPGQAQVSRVLLGLGQHDVPPAQGIGRGTKIGESLAPFNRWHARRIINSRTALMIVSDGYDTGEAAQLGEEMRRLRRRCRKIIWLNPLIGWRDYTPQARGMQAALPYVDLFAPAHNLESLAALEPYLAKI